MAKSYLTEAKTTGLINKWNKRISLVESVQKTPLTLEKKAALATTLENTKHLLEATQSRDIGQYKRFALDLVGAVVPNLISYDLVSVQAIDNRVGMVNYIKYLYGSNKGTTVAGTEFASSLNLGKSDPNYTTDLVDVEILGNSGETTYEVSLQWSPVTPGSVNINTGDVLITDDGAGKLTAESGLTSGEINYQTGLVKFTLESSATQDVAASYSYNNEYVVSPNIPEINLKIESLPVIAKARRLKALYGFEASFELQKEYGQDIETLLASQAAAEIAHEIDIELTNDLYRMANAGAEVVWSKTAPTGVSQSDHYLSFQTSMTQASNTIYGATRRVRANFMVCGLNVATVVESMRTFTPSGVTNMNGPYYLGTIGNIKIYVNPEFDPNVYVMGYKGDDLLQTGYIYAPYMPITRSDMVMLEDMAGRIGWATMYAKRMVNDKMYIRGRITD